MSLVHHGSLHVWNGNTSRHYPCNEIPVAFRGICSMRKGSPRSSHPRSERYYGILLGICLGCNDVMSQCLCPPNDLLIYQCLDVHSKTTSNDDSTRMWLLFGQILLQDPGITYLLIGNVTEIALCLVLRFKVIVLNKKNCKTLYAIMLLVTTC